ncbi:MAG: hypothetical protein KGM15_17935 [Pseudomonadota bacterium]|nr:hypothetical protein [Pseudomonadota bacterium]
MREWRDWGCPIPNEPLPLNNGAIEIPDRPGIGIEGNEAAAPSEAIHDSALGPRRLH